jgi:hypothetical protein
MRRYLSGILIVLTLLATAAVCAGYYLMALRSETVSTVPTPSLVKGYVSFLSSEQLMNKNNGQGIDDEVRIDMTTIPDSVRQKSYYAWLLSDKNQSDPFSLLLGALPVKEGAAHLFYPGSMQHINLLKIMGRFLVTEEDASLTPVSPSPDMTTWHYYAKFTQTLPSPSSQYGSALSHTQSFPIYSLHKGA